MTDSSPVGSFFLDVDDKGIATVTFDRPPVNSVAMVVYEELAELARRIEADDRVRVVILTAPADARAWCGGADLNDFVDMTPARRRERYARVNELLPALNELERPTIAAINAHTVGIGVVLAALCDIRVASDAATFACREIDYGLVPGESRLLESAGIPRGTVREMLLTGRRFSAREMREAGFLNAVVGRGEVLAAANEIAALIAAKSLPSLKAAKRTLHAVEELAWPEAYLVAQEESALLHAGADAGEGVQAFLEGRAPRLTDG